MKLKRASIIRSAVAFVIAAAGIGSQVAMGDETLRSGDSISMDKWYGRAGGLVGSDRVMAIRKSSADRVGIAYDADVAKRTNMQREGATNGNVAITHDKDVAERTNMQRDVPPVQSAGQPAAPHN
jgi:hypothetical protein